MDIRKLAPGDRLLDYKLVERLGEGGFGEVFKAEHEVLGRTVAIKIPRDQGSLEALRHEGVVQASLEHGNIVRTLELSLSHDPPYVVMEFVDGCSLAELIRQEGALPWRRAARILLDVSRALAHAHSRGIVHGDVKPGNVLVEKSRKGRVLLTDFGLGRTVDPQGSVAISRSLELATSAGAVQGTIRYLAPEILRGETPDARSDIYSFGVLLFETLTGRLPEGREVPSDLVRELPEELDKVFARTFTRKERRPTSFETTVAELEQLVDGGLRVASDASSTKSRSAKRPSGTGTTKEEPAPATAAPAPVVRAIPAEAPLLPAVVPAVRVEEHVAAPASCHSRAGSSACERHARPAPATTTASDEDPRFARWRDVLVEKVKGSVDLSGVVAGDAQGFDLCLGVEADGEPHHRVFLLVVGRLDLNQARAIAQNARRVFEREKGIWEKEVTFCVLAREVTEVDQVLWTFKSFSMGWWRRRRMVLHDLAQDRLYATELGCDPQGNPLKRAVLAASREAVQSVAWELPEPVALPPCLRRTPRGTAWGAGVALITALGVLGSLMAVEFAARCAGLGKRCGHKPAAATFVQGAPGDTPGLIAAPGEESAAEAAAVVVVVPVEGSSPGIVLPPVPDRRPDSFAPCEPAMDDVY